MPIQEYGLRILREYSETISDGDGVRYSIYLAGCRHRCPGCHNPQSWAPDQGTLLDEQQLHRIINAIQNNGFLDGITVSGGDPFFNPEGLAAFLQAIKQATGTNVWCYTGYTLEEILDSPPLQPPLRYIDVLVDGRYEAALADPNLPFRGSSNQRVIRDPWAYLPGATPPREG